MKCNNLPMMARHKRVLDWFRRNIAGNPHLLRRKTWFAVDSPVNQSNDVFIRAESIIFFQAKNSAPDPGCWLQHGLLEDISEK